MDNKYELGVQKLKELLGDKAGEELIAGFHKISPEFAKIDVEFVDGDLFQRKGLTDKTRVVAIVGCLLGQNNSNLPLRRYLRIMLNLGWTKEEVLEIIILLSAYAGFPTAICSLYVADEVIAEFEKDQAIKKS